MNGKIGSANGIGTMEGAGVMKTASSGLTKRALAQPPAWVLARSKQERGARALACVVDLPRICRLRKCRRSALCLGDEPRCLKEHAGLGASRWQAVQAREKAATRRRRSRPCA